MEILEIESKLKELRNKSSKLINRLQKLDFNKRAKYGKLYSEITDLGFSIDYYQRKLESLKSAV